MVKCDEWKIFCCRSYHDRNGKWNRGKIALARFIDGKYVKGSLYYMGVRGHTRDERDDSAFNTILSSLK